MCYATSINGLSDAQFNQVRRIMGATTKAKVKGRSLTMDILTVVGKCDPYQTTTGEAVEMWARAVFHRWFPT